MYIFSACSVFYIAQRHDILINLCMSVYVCESVCTLLLLDSGSYISEFVCKFFESNDTVHDTHTKHSDTRSQKHTSNFTIIK